MGASSSLLLCVAILGGNGKSEIILDRVDLIEVNHYHDDQGRAVWDQIIFYDWSPTLDRYVVRDWRLAKHTGQIPIRDWQQGTFVSVWHDHKDHDVLRKVESKLIRETWTQYDPERVELESLPDGKRKKLTPSTATMEANAARHRTASRGIVPLQRPQPRPMDVPRPHEVR